MLSFVFCETLNNVFRCKTLDRIIFCQFILTDGQTASLLAVAGFQLKYLSLWTELGEAAVSSESLLFSVYTDPITAEQSEI